MTNIISYLYITKLNKIPKISYYYFYYQNFNIIKNFNIILIKKMLTPNTHFGEYFKKSVLHLSKYKIVFLIISIAEFMEVLVCLLEYQDFFFLLNQNYSDAQTQLAKLLLSIIPFSYYFDYLIMCSFKVIYNAIFIYLSLVICFIIYLIFIKKSNDEIQINSVLNNIIDKICVNFFDLVLFRLAPLYGINAVVRVFFKLLKLSNYSVVEIIIEFLLILFLVFIIFLHYYYFTNICIWNNFKVIDMYFSKYPYETFYSKKYDIVMFTLKLLIILAKNYLNYNSNIANFIVLFLSLLLEVIFFGFVFYTFYLLFFSKNVLYFYLNFYNKIRVFFLLFMTEALVIRFGLHKNGDYIPYLSFMIVLLIFNFYFILSILDSYILTSAISSQNYVGVCWFIQGNDVNIQNFTIEWISNHREKCILDSNICPVCSKICSKLKKNFNINKEEGLQLLENDNNRTNVNKTNNKSPSHKFHNKSTVKNRNIIKKTIIDELFSPFRFFCDLLKLAEKSKKFMTKDDLIRLDILYVAALFYNEKNNDYYFYTKLCFFLIKYKENPQVLMTLILIFEIMRKESISTSQKYQILKKNEELRYSLEEYLKDYNEFFLYSNKTPINYFMISQKYKKFKDLLKTIHIYFKKNIECNYELIVMRYIYEVLVHQKAKNIQPFDLNNYADFIEHHYINNKSFLMKNIIDQDVFIILKGSKEILKFQNKHFESLFPSEFQNDAINKFKKKLTNLDQKETNPFFEYSIDSFINSTSQKFDFVDSFKMKYTIYPTYLINELYIQVNYIAGYNNIIIFEKNVYGFEVLYSFSPKLYKIFGIYPSDIYLLKKAGIFIYFADIFKKSRKSKNNQEKNVKDIFVFEYEKYLLLLKRLLTFDILKDSPNYNQIVDKKNEFELMGEAKKEIQFRLTIKFEYKSDNNKLYTFFSIKEIRKKQNDKTVAKNTSNISNYLFGLNTDNEENSDSNEDNFDFLKDDVFEGKGMTMAGSILSSSSAKDSFESVESGKQKGKKDEKLDEKRKKKEQLNRYTYILLCFSIILIIINVVFLILETSENNYFRKVINLFIVFRQFKRGIERIPLTLICNFNFYYKENTSVNVYEQYSENLGKKSKILSEHLVSNILIAEISGKISTIVDSFNNYQKEINSLGSSLADKINALKGKAYRIFISDKIKCVKISASYISLFRQYLNSISTLLKDSTYYGVDFPLMNTSDLDDSNSIIETPSTFKTENTDIMKNMLYLLYSYPYAHSGLVETATAILDKNRDIIDIITKVLIIFFIILIIFHIVLGLVSILFIVSFTKILKLNISDSNKLFGDKKFLEFSQRRLEQIKIIKNLYSENPLKITAKIEAMEEFYKRKKNDENKATNNKNYTNVVEAITLSDKNQKDKNEFEKDDKSEISKKFKKNYDQQNILAFNSKTESFITDNENNNNIKNNKISDLKDSEFNENKFENGITSKNIQLTQKQFKPILRIQYILVYLSIGVYFIYSIILFIIVYFKGIVLLSHLVDYSNYNDLIDGYIFDTTNALLFMIQTNCTSLDYGYITNPDRKNNYIEEGIDLLHDTIVGKDDIELFREDYFQPLNKLINMNCSEGIVTNSDFMKIAANQGFDYDEYFGELCKIFPVARAKSDTRIFQEILFLIDILYRNFSTHKNFEEMFVSHLNQKRLYDLYTIILTFNRIQRNYFNTKIYPNEVEGVLDIFAKLMYIYLIISVLLEIIIFLVVYLGIIEKVKKKDNLIMNFLESLKYE